MYFNKILLNKDDRRSITSQSCRIIYITWQSLRSIFKQYEIHLNKETKVSAGYNEIDKLIIEQKNQLTSEQRKSLMKFWVRSARDLSLLFSVATSVCKKVSHMKNENSSISINTINATAPFAFLFCLLGYKKISLCNYI